MRFSTLTFAAGAAVGYYVGSRPRQQAFAEVRRAAEVGLDGAVQVRQRIAQFREDHPHDTPHDQASHDQASEPLTWPASPAPASTDWDMALLADDDVLDEMGRESFPSSDPPSTWAGPDDSFPRGARP